jgi:ubiquinone/menaquinone biosynthesis C-methylase UbiE
VDLVEYREKSHDIWEKVAPGWDRHRARMWDFSRAIGERLVERLDPQPGQKILELAAGVGETGFAAAARLGDEGRLMSTDFSEAMLEAARKRGEELGVANVDYRVLDAEQMDLEDASVDGVLCRFGYMLMADPAKAFVETRRVLKAGGRVAFAVWGTPLRNPWVSLGGLALVQHGHMPMPEPDAPGMFAMAEPERIHELVTGAGFGEPAIEEVAVEWRFEGIDDYWHLMGDTAGGLALVLRELSEQEREAVRETWRENAEDFRRDGGYVMPGVALTAVAGYSD